MVNEQSSRVVVTGIGLSTPLGCNHIEVFTQLYQGKHGFKRVDFGEKLGALVCGQFESTPDWGAVIGSKDERIFDPFICHGLWAAHLALEDSQINPTRLDLNRCGVAVGSGLGGLNKAENAMQGLENRGLRGVSPYFMPAYLINVLPGLVAMRHGFKGANYSMVSACATGVHNIGSAAEFIASGRADVMLAGASDFGTTDISVAGFKALKALSGNLDPDAASRPWDEARDGFVIADGAAILLLESESHALARGAKIYCTIDGFGMSGDAHHVTQPAPAGEGAKRAMQAALSAANIDANAVDLVCAHGTSTPAGDEAEAQAIESVFSNHGKVNVMSSKSMLGHALGAAGAIESGLCAMMLANQKVLPTANTRNLSREYGFNLVRTGYSDQLTKVVNNSFGFGGTNASLVLGAYR